MLLSSVGRFVVRMSGADDGPITSLQGIDVAAELRQVNAHWTPRVCGRQWPGPEKEPFTSSKGPIPLLIDSGMAPFGFLDG